MREDEEENMSADRIKELTRQGDAAQAAAEALDQDITNALADGADEHIVADMRQRRREFVEQADDIGGAIAVLQARQNDPNENAKIANAAKARKDAKTDADAYVRSAAAVDRALVALEAAFIDMRARGSDLQRSLRQAGISDNARISNTLGPSSRWSVWANAPAFAESVNVAFTPHAKRTRLSESAKRVVPQIPE